MNRQRQRGVALLVAIVIFAIATTVAAAVTYNKAMSARRAAANFTLEAALQAGMAAEALASIALEDAGSKPQITTVQDWAQPQPPLEIPDTGIWIQASVEDLSGRFNLNSLIKWDPQKNEFVENKLQLEVFRTLLGSLDIDVKYADLLMDWIDPDLSPAPSGGGEDTLYLSQSPPYRPPNTFIMHPSELLALPGFGRENYQKLAPYVAALPNGEPLNLCTASGLVLDAALNQHTTQFANQDLSVDREKGCYPERQVYMNAIPPDAPDRAEVESSVGEKSSWFRLRTQVRIGTADFVLYSVLYVEPNGFKTRPLQRSFGSE